MHWRPTQLIPKAHYSNLLESVKYFWFYWQFSLPLLYPKNLLIFLLSTSINISPSIDWEDFLFLPSFLSIVYFVKWALDNRNEKILKKEKYEEREGKKIITAVFFHLIKFNFSATMTFSLLYHKRNVTLALIFFAHHKTVVYDLLILTHIASWFYYWYCKRSRFR